MLRRLTALVFVLFLAGNVWAGLCGCIDGGDHSASACCKRERSEHTSISPKPCCGSECGQPAMSNVHRTKSESGVKVFGSHIPAEPVRSFVPMPLIGLEREPLFVIQYPQDPLFPRPPDLFIKHSSFLI